MRRVFAISCAVLVCFGLLAPKLAVLALHLNPSILELIVCTGSERVIVHLDRDGQPIEVIDAAHSDCVFTKSDDIAYYVRWVLAPKSYRGGFHNIAALWRGHDERGLLPQLRAPPEHVI